MGSRKRVPLTQVPALGLTRVPSGWHCAWLQEGPGSKSQYREASGESLAQDTVHRPCSPPAPATLCKFQFSHLKTGGHSSSCQTVCVQEAAAGSKSEGLVMPASSGELPKEGSHRKGREPRRRGPRSMHKQSRSHGGNWGQDPPGCPVWEGGPRGRRRLGTHSDLPTSHQWPQSV